VKLYEIPFSTNVERVTLTLAFKGLGAEHVLCDPADRSPIVALSGQELVPVLELDDGTVIADSMAIMRRLDDDHLAPPLWPDDASRAAEIDVFADWFNRVWKVAPNRMAPGDAEELRGSLDRFEALLDGRDFLLGDGFGIADVVAFPFLKYAILWEDGDEERFHEVLRETQRFDARYPRLEAWIHRVDALPRA